MICGGVDTERGLTFFGGGGGGLSLKTSSHKKFCGWNKVNTLVQVEGTQVRGGGRTLTYQCERFRCGYGGLLQGVEVGGDFFWFVSQASPPHFIIIVRLHGWYNIIHCLF